MRTSLTTRRTLSERVAAEIRAHMGREMVKQSELARLLNTNDQWLSVRLRARQPIDLNDLERIANALGIEVDIQLGKETAGIRPVSAGRKGTRQYPTRPKGRTDAVTRPPDRSGDRRSDYTRSRGTAAA